MLGFRVVRRKIENVARGASNELLQPPLSKLITEVYEVYKVNRQDNVDLI